MQGGGREDSARLERRLHLSHERVLDLERELASVRQSLTYRLGALLVQACRNPAGAVRAFVELLRLGRAAFRSGHSHPVSLKSPKPSDVGLRPDGLRPGDTVEVPTLRDGLPSSKEGEGGPVVAAILGSSSACCLRYEVRLVLLAKETWRQEIEHARPDFLLVESIRAGKGHDWSTASESHEARREGLPGVLRYCRERNLPTILWHTENRIPGDGLLELARAFDVVFTTEEESARRFRERGNHYRVHVLPPAAQPRLHNPCREHGWPRYAVCVAGARPSSSASPHCRDELRDLLDPARRFDVHVLDDVSPERVAAAYRCYDLMLNAADTTTTSVPRRVFESLASGTPVISTDSPGLHDLLGSHVRITRSASGTTAHLEALLNDEEALAREAHLGYRHVHQHHTWRHRLDEMLGCLGTEPLQRRRATVSVVMPIMRPQNLIRAVKNFARQSHPDKELLLVLNNAQFDPERIREAVRAISEVHVLHLPGRPTLGECLNRAAQRAAGRYVAKMDDDDHYGSAYLSDLVLTARFSDAEVLGKGTHYAYVESRDVMVLRVMSREHAYAPDVSGATLFVDRDVLLRVPFRNVTPREDILFLRDVQSAGCRIYSADRFNFLAVRRRGRPAHTWRIPDDKFLETCRYVQPGLHLSRAML